MNTYEENKELIKNTELKTLTPVQVERIRRFALDAIELWESLK